MADEGYDKDKHPDPPWKWIPKELKHPDEGEDGGVKGNYWELEGSANSTYNCTTYTVYKVQGQAPGDFVQESDVITKLTGLGYQETDGSKCGCEKDKLKNCTVVYRKKDSSKTVFHAAVLDPKLCDWGGKETGSKPIIRYKTPEDYLKGSDKTSRENMEMVFYCKEAESPYISDKDMSDGAKKPEGKNGGGNCLLVVTALVVLFTFLFQTVRP